METYNTGKLGGIDIAGFKVNVRTNINPNMLDKATRRADEVLAVQAMKDTDPFVPALTGSLSERTRVVQNQIIYPGPYAKYLYHGKLMVDPATGSPWATKGAVKKLTDRDLVFNKSMHSDAQSHWFEASKAMNLPKWLRVYKKAVMDNK